MFSLTPSSRFYNLVIAVSLAFSNYGVNAEPLPQEKYQNQPNIVQFDLLTATTGWVLVDHNLFWTTDSGQTWDEIAPSVPPDAAIQDVEFINSDTGWMLWTTLNADLSSNFILAHTTDHGQNWSIITLSLFESGEVSAHSEKADMGWLDAQTGWISIKQSSSSNFSLGTLFTTSDGGNSWVRSPLPIADHVIFSNSQVGWTTGGPTGGQIFKTQNGGITWQSVQPEHLLNPFTNIYSPFYVDGQGLLVITGYDPKDGLDLHIYSELSNNWMPAGQVSLKAQSGALGLSIIDLQNFVAVIPGTNSIVRMENGVLETLENQDGRSSSITVLDMISLDFGWAKSVDSKCEIVSSLEEEPDSVLCTSNTRLLKTDNGGVAWHELSLPGVQPNAVQRNEFEMIRPDEPSANATQGNTETFIGQGFDKCEIPTISQLQTWWDSSPYKTVNIYMGGSNRACSNNALSETYLRQLNQQGWNFIPTWVGPQAPCTSYPSVMSSDPAAAFNQGVDEANLAAERLAELGLTYPDKSGSVVYYDIEYYGAGSTVIACRNAVNAFMNGWVSQLHKLGNLAGVYGSTLCGTGLSDFLNITNVPDVIWPARWYHNLGDGYYDPTATVWNLGSCIPNTEWVDHQRIRQYEGDHDETWGNLTLGIDSNVIDGVAAVPVSSPDPDKMFFQEVATGLNNPVFITHAGDGSDRLFVVERHGKIRIIRNGTLLSTPFLDLQSTVKSANGEQGLLGLAFHPSYDGNGKFYVVYTASRNGDSNGSILTLRQYSVSSVSPDIADTASGTTILTIDHPSYTNHNGGTIAFGNDGYLYWSTGDGGGGGDPDNNGQDLTSLLGKILRIDVDSGSPFSIPASNPFYGSSNANTQLIWAYGLRNPWRMSFDRLTHDLYIGDVGQSAREEIDFQPASSLGGENYGWDIMEGSTCYNTSTCDTTDKVLPIAEYSHSLGCSVTGGHVYRGTDSPALNGYYFYGDFCQGRLFSLHNPSGTGWEAVQLLDTSFSISTFGEDEQGELYLADYGTGKIYKIAYQTWTFIDVPPSQPYFDYIETLYANGLTNGCSISPPKYCPDSIMNRAQVAKFFMTVEFGDSYLPPSDTPLVFQDSWKINPWAELWANDMYAKGLTNGCSASPLRYCPDNQVIREQVAKFGLAIKYGNSYEPPPATGMVFADLADPDYWATAWAEQAYAEGLIPACGTDSSTGKPLICPFAKVNRGFAAFVIVNATGLLDP